MEDLQLQLIEGIYHMGFSIENYVTLNAITPEQYKQITGKDYVAPATVA